MFKISSIGVFYVSLANELIELYMTTLWLMHDNIALFLLDKTLCRFNEEFGIFHNTDLFWG